LSVFGVAVRNVNGEKVMYGEPLFSSVVTTGTLSAPPPKPRSAPKLS